MTSIATAAAIGTIDHVVIVVGDLQVSAELYRRLGFGGCFHDTSLIDGEFGRLFVAPLVRSPEVARAQWRTLLEADFFIRYYELDEWRALLGEVGFDVDWAVGGLDGAALNKSSTDEIVGAKRRA